MSILSVVFVVAMGVLHLGIMGLEMFAPVAVQAKSFGLPESFVHQREAQVALRNQGIYNGALGACFLAVLFVFSGTAQVKVAVMLCEFVLLVGVYGGLTATKKIFLIQALPAVITLASLLL